MSSFFFSGAVDTKLDEKNRFVLPQEFRFGLVEDGKLEFTIALGLGGCLTIYKRSEIEKMVSRFRKKAHSARYQKFFTLFFSTLFHTTCDKLGRIVLPPVLKRAAKIESELVIAGVLNKIEIWPQEAYYQNLEAAFSLEGEAAEEMAQMAEEAFSLVDGEEAVSDAEQAEYEAI